MTKRKRKEGNDENEDNKDTQYSTPLSKSFNESIKSNNNKNNDNKGALNLSTIEYSENANVIKSPDTFYKSEDEDISSINNEDNKPYRKKLIEGEPGTLTGRPLRLYADGIFDLFHFGHARALQQCKEAYPNTYLLVGCNNDKMTHELKGMTVMDENERYESLRHCKWVDEVVENAPWVITDEFLNKYKIDYVCHDALPYTDSSGESADGDVYARIKKMGKFLETQRTEGISTTDLIIRIISEYDTFIRRNLQRGYTGKEMKVPFIKEQSIKLDIALENATKKTKHAVKEVDELLHKWINKAEDFQHGFVELFSRDGPIRTSLRKRRKIIKERLNEVARESFC